MANLPDIFIWNALGANRIEHLAVDRLSEAFEKTAAPGVGAIGIAVQTGENEHDEPTFVGVAMIHSVSGVASGTVRASFRPVYRLRTPVPLSEVAASTKILSDALTIPPKFFPSLLLRHVGADVIAKLVALDPGLFDWITQLTSPPRSFPPGIEQARVEARDAVRLAAQISDIELPADALVSDIEGVTDEDLLETVVNSAYQVDLEEELLPLDLQRFNRKLKGKQVAASMSVFSDKSREHVLSVVCVNKKPLEEEMGVDLFYWDKVNDVFTFVQYKRLEKAPSQSEGLYEWAYKRRGELIKQLALMPRSTKIDRSSKDWRLAETPFWFKFVRGDAAVRSDGQVLKGMYVSADWLRLAIDGGDLKSGPKGGFRLTYGNAKYIGRSAFTHLVARGLLGTSSSQSLSFKRVFRSLGKDRQVILAVKSEWEDPAPIPSPATSTNDSESARPF
ncbi:hypothetical protein N1028_01550 [Herbiconiux sp. CPCC 203407]|uniref:Uncharacterized protein n=1 Tax=Herbiconiux oxytropis TaxID=2970915 RepID=A0AA41XAF2_9MICO|nr:hypothetical protein [Herbiconiux oxytropis]MCS5721495.1 hypothetical protein [Herbiconiux oxytropis]MCS5724572.1 hypothetical protein [Herbiconiux oxytropis]